MGVIKKHKIGVSRDDQRSSFVVDLRPPKAKEKDKVEELKKPKVKSRKTRINFSRLKKITFYPIFWLIFKLLELLAWPFRKIKFKKSKPKNQKLPLKFKTLPNINLKIKQAYQSSKSRSVFYFILLLFLIVIPFKLFSYYKLISEHKTQKNILNYSYQALSKLGEASLDFSQLDLSSAQQNFLAAGESFLLIQEELNKIDEFLIFLASFSKDNKLKLASESKKISQIGLDLSIAGDNFTLAVEALFRSFSEPAAFSEFQNYSQKLESDIKRINKNLSQIKVKSIPSEYQEQFLNIKNQALVLERNFSSFLKLIPGLKDFIGLESDRRYLIIFQNNAEIRATGGFIGSYALIDIKKGQIERVEVPAGGSYDTAGSLKVLMESPKPLHLIRPQWYFWDANWWPDWRMSAQNLKWFYEKSGGSSVDGVIAITPDILGDLLEITGPIDISSDYGIIVDSNNYWDLIQEIVEVTGKPELYQEMELQTDVLERLESEPDKWLRNEPKRIIGDLMVKVLDQFFKNFNQETLLKSLEMLERNLNQKNILLYFDNPELQKEVEYRSWAGEVKEAPLDYLMVVNSNIAGAKTDKVVESNYSLSSELRADGTIWNKLVIERQHPANESNLFYGVRNVNWMRIYVPLGSTLVRAQGFVAPDKEYFKKSEDFLEKNEILESSENRAELDLESGTKIYQESGKTVFANWTMLDPGQSQVIEIEYQLPFRLSFSSSLNYSLLWQKQAGASKTKFKYDFSNSSPLRVIWSYPEKTDLKFNGPLEYDRYFVIKLE
ncbi:MAG: DUF4012 domain-containing protein [Patescibacteria group bacterium]|jgi:hypothetical protein